MSRYCRSLDVCVPPVYFKLVIITLDILMTAELLFLKLDNCYFMADLFINSCF